MPSLTSESDARRLEGASLGDGDSQEAMRFLQPFAGRMIAGVGLANERLATRHHSSIARRIVLGRQVMRIVAKGHMPL